MRILPIAIVLLLAACGETSKEFEKGFKDAFEKKFAESCTTSAMDEGVPAERKPVVVELCACTAKTLVSRYSVTQLTAMGAGGNKELVEGAVEECAKR